MKNLTRIGIAAAALVVFNGMMGLVQAADPAVSSTPGGAGAEWSKQILDIRSRVLAVRRGVEESRWYITKPFRAKNLAVKFSPEQGVDLKEKLRDGKKMFWNSMEWLDGQDVEVEWPGSSSVYLFRNISASQPAKLAVEFGCEGGLQVFLNGQQVISKEKLDGPREKLTLDLVKGKNELLVKIFHDAGKQLFYYSSGPVVTTEFERMGEKFQAANLLFTTYFPNNPRWFCDDSTTRLEQQAISSVLQRMKSVEKEKAQLDELVKNKTASSDPAWINLLVAVGEKSKSFDDAVALLTSLNLKAMRLAINDLITTYPDKYKNGQAYLTRLDEIEKEMPAIELARTNGASQAIVDFGRKCGELSREALVAGNPVVDFDKILLIKRDAKRLCLPANWQGNSSIKTPTVNELATLSIKEKDGALCRVYKPEAELFVGDVRLHFDGDRVLFSSLGTSNRWQVFEMKINPVTGQRAGGADLRQVTSGEFNDIDNYDGMYLPDGRIIFDSSSTFQGVPCVGGSDYVANLHIMTADGKNVRRLTYDQDNDWCPTMMPDGRVMYTRWEYTDSAHYFSRILMRMNPDGTGQTAFYGSNSYWPNSLFYCKPLPHSPSMFVGIVSGHHGVARMGELVVFDANRSRHEAGGAVQRIPGYGKKVEPVIMDGLVNASWPKFLHPFPLSDKYFLVAGKMDAKSNWGIYLVDIFDNMVLLKEQAGFAMLEPVPLRKVTPPPVIPDKVDLKKKTATVSIQDIYAGPGIEGVARGTVKSLRVFQYEFSYRNMGGHYQIGMEGPWDVRRLIGTVPLNEDGSAAFEIPANTPVAIQPLDGEGKALQQMRSWLVGMPGERVSCIGCHEAQNSTIVQKIPEAARHDPVVPTAWFGPKRGFSFLREVQPVLDRNCTGCHDGSKTNRPNLADVKIVSTTTGSALPVSYLNLHPYVRRNGPEGDYTMLTPLEFHANTSELVQMLQKGHYNVKLDAESWSRIITWIDLNVPCYGAWSETRQIPNDFAQRRYEMKKLYSNVDEDIETQPVMPTNRVPYVAPAPMPAKPAAVKIAGWPFDAAKAAEMQKALGKTEFTIELGNGLAMSFKKIPAGKFVMGDLSGECDEYPTAEVEIKKPFWMGVTEVSLEQYRACVPGHNNGYYDMHYKDQVKPGYLMDDPKLPVIRVSWNESMAFCRWLGQKSGKKVSLPTEAEWEWACRAGADTAMNYGDLNADFSKLENLGDQSLSLMAVSGVNPQPIKNPDKFWDFIPKEARFNDGVLHLAPTDSFQANCWGLKNMHGNAREWTLSNYRAYPWSDKAGKDDATATGNKVVRGGSWYERPKYARSAFRLAFPEWQKVYNVGFRVVVEE